MHDEKMKRYCANCGWHGQSSETLQAPNPFERRETIAGCPQCLQVETIGVACFEDGCWQQATCGFNTPQGYRHTCGKHMLPYEQLYGFKGPNA